MFMMVADPQIYNHNFKVPTRMQSTLDSNAVATASVFDVVATDWGDYCKHGDYVIIGPSSVSKDKGKSERFQIASAGGGSGKTVSLISGSVLWNNYYAGDTVTIVGTKIASGWELDCSEAVMSGVGIGPIYADKDSIGFNVDNYKQRLVRSVGIAVNSYLKYTITEKLRPSTVYRLVLSYQFKNQTHGGGQWFTLNWNGQVVGISLSTLLNVQAKITGTGTTISTIYSGDADLYLLASPLSSWDSLDLDLVALGHAAFTSDSANGRLSFPNNPITEPVVKFNRRQIKGISSLDGTHKYFNRVGDSNSNISIAFQTRVTSAFLKDLEILKFWMAQGKKIIFEHDMVPGASSSIRDAIPTILIGTFNYSINFSSWDTLAPKINFIFTGE